MKQEHRTRILMFIAGLSLGTVVGLLAAPEPGAETRRRIASKAQGGREFLDKTREVYHAGVRMAEEAAEIFEDGRKLVKG